MPVNVNSVNGRISFYNEYINDIVKVENIIDNVKNLSQHISKTEFYSITCCL